MSSPTTALHRFASSPDGAGRCVRCGGRGAERQHRRPAACTKTGPHGSHGACPGRDFPTEIQLPKAWQR